MSTAVPAQQRAARYLEDLDAGREEDTTLARPDWRAARQRATAFGASRLMSRIRTPVPV
ncbi:hypothetical protein [Nocardia otitidiscaviarum]|uniref:hypothetical protein n=1 Tax=Nocardia otitidiscaviarum TaxID=1823 RepID=UPI0012FA3FE1|nr:hypothetical protein [Nocardia otitidiscaviarum]